MNRRLLLAGLSTLLVAGALRAQPQQVLGGPLSPAGGPSELPARDLSVLRVRPLAPPGGDGTSWPSALGDLQEALDRAAALPHVREVWVAAGTYSGGFVVPAGVRVYGGFAVGDRSREQRRPALTPSVLDGGGTQRVLELEDACLVDGFLVRNGRASAPGGGGALVNGTAPHLRNCTFTGNTNSGGRGSALAIRLGGAPLVESCVFTLNGGPGSGHAVDCEASGGRYENIAVWDNVSNGFHFQGGATPVIRNSVFGLNTGRGICHISASDAPSVERCLLWNNGVSLMHVTGAELHTIAQVNALPYAADNVTGDPLFIDAANLDFRVAAGSPCVDAGHFATFPTRAVDARGTPRVLDGDLDGLLRVDIGPYELDNVGLSLTSVRGGGDVAFAVDGTPGMTFQVWIGPPSHGHEDPPFGVQLFDVMASGRPLASGTSPSSGVVTIPGRYPSGTVLALQALATGGANVGNWSNAVHVVAP